MDSWKLSVAPVGMADGTVLQVARVEPEGLLKGVIQVLHGFGEHHGSYHALAGFFAEHGYACVIHDQRGHGSMPGLTGRARKRKLGVLRTYDCFLDDVGTLRERISQWYPGLPVYLYGHSMGGNVALNYLIKRTQREYERVVVETPWLRLHTPKPKPLVWAARFLGKLSPSFAVTDKLNVDAISRDPGRVAEIKADPYYHNRISFRLFTQITDAGAYSIANAEKLTLPTLLFGAGDDRIVSTGAIVEFAEAAGENVTLYTLPKGRHALHSDAEPTKGEMFQRALAFLNAE